MQKFEAVLVENEKDLVLMREREWEEERKRFQETIKQHHEVIQNADAHIEAEIQTLHSQVSQQCQEQMEKHLRVLEEEYEEKLKCSAEEVEKLVAQIENMHDNIQKMHSKYAKDVKNLGSKLELAEQNLQKLKVTMDAHKQEREELKARLEKSEKQRQDTSVAYQRAEEEHAKIVNGYKGKLQELNERVQRTEKHLRLMESRSKKQLKVITDSLEREHANAIENLKARFVEQHREGAAKRDAEKEGFELAKRNLEERVRSIKAELQAVRKELVKKDAQLQRQQTSTPTQVC
jgi:hypothetical protein